MVLDLDAEPKTPDEARAWIASVRQSIEEYRDEQRLSLIRARDRFSLAAGVAELLTAVLVAIAIAQHGPPSQIVAALTFYLVGALAGLIKRLAAEADELGAVQDFGFTSARIAHTPVLSGLAGLGGVMLVALLPALQPHLSTPSPTATAAPTATVTVVSPTSTGDESRASTLTEILDLSRNTHFLILAAIFGLTPGLLTGRLQELGQQLQSNLQSSGRTGPP